MILVVALVAAQGCVVIPIPVPQPWQRELTGTRVSDQALASIEVGVTSKEAVRALLGEPTVFWEEEHVFGYYWVMQAGIVVIITQGPSGLGGWSAPHALLIQFDAEDIVSRVERTTGAPRDVYSQTVVKWREGAR